MSIACHFLGISSHGQKIRIGNLLGENNPKRAGVASNTSLLMSLFMSGISWYVSHAMLGIFVAVLLNIASVRCCLCSGTLGESCSVTPTVR